MEKIALQAEGRNGVVNAEMEWDKCEVNAKIVGKGKHYFIVCMEEQLERSKLEMRGIVENELRYWADSLEVFEQSKSQL